MQPRPKGAVPECGQLGSGGMWAFACAVGSDADAAKWLKPRYYSGHFLRSRRLARSMHKDLRTPVITGTLAHNVAEVMKSPRLESLLQTLDSKRLGADSFPVGSSERADGTMRRITISSSSGCGIEMKRRLA
jgi:hypothetical protein